MEREEIKENLRIFVLRAHLALVKSGPDKNPAASLTEGLNRRSSLLRRRIFADVYSNKWCSHVVPRVCICFWQHSVDRKPLASPTSFTLNDSMRGGLKVNRTELCTNGSILEVCLC